MFEIAKSRKFATLLVISCGFSIVLLLEHFSFVFLDIESHRIKSLICNSARYAGGLELDL